MVNPKEMQNGIGEWMSTCFGIVDSYNLLYKMFICFFFFETVLQEMLTHFVVLRTWHDMFLCINDILIPTAAVAARPLLGDSISSGII